MLEQNQWQFWSNSDQSYREIFLNFGQEFFIGGQMSKMCIFGNNYSTIQNYPIIEKYNKNSYYVCSKFHADSKTVLIFVLHE